MPDPVAPIASTETQTILPDPSMNAPDVDTGKGGDAPGEVEPWRKVKHKFKAMGEEHEVDYDDLVKRAEKSVGAEKRLAEASRKEKEIQAKLEKLRTVEDISEVVELLGGNDRARPLLEKFLWNKIQEEEHEAKLSPTERDAKRRADDAEKKAREAQQKLDELNKSAESESKAQTNNKANEIINREISDAIAEAEKAGLSPEDVPFMIEELISNMIVHLEYLEDCEEAGIPPTQSPLSPRDVLRKLQSKDSDRARGWLKKLSPKDLRDLLSAEQLDGLRKSDIEALTQPSTQNRATTKKKSDSPAIDPFTADKKETKKKPNTKDWFSAMDQRYRNNGR